MSKDGLYQQFRDWWALRPRAGGVERGQFWKDLRTIVGPGLRDPRIGGQGSRTYCVEFPPLNECRASFSEFIGCAWQDLA